MIREISAGGKLHEAYLEILKQLTKKQIEREAINWNLCPKKPYRIARGDTRVNSRLIPFLNHLITVALPLHTLRIRKAEDAYNYVMKNEITVLDKLNEKK